MNCHKAISTYEKGPKLYDDDGNEINGTAEIQKLYNLGKESFLHTDFICGNFTPREPDESAGPDDFVLQIGNYLAYSSPLWQGSDYFIQL